MDAANVDLKSFSDDFYRRITGARLAPVLETLEYVARETDCWLEVTTLLIPGHNDSDKEIHALVEWVAEHLGKDVPLHFSAFHPDNRMRDVPRTPASTLVRARRAGMEAGLNYVYTGNVRFPEGDTTYCPGCGAAVVERDAYEILACRLAVDACQSCGTAIPGRWDPAGPGHWGSRRQPIRL
jgi:pyruvate formate lyase activating enzyme